MPIIPKDFLDNAQDQLAQNTEPAWRSAASRAYYAAFHGARQFADTTGVDTLEHLKTGEHDRLILRFEQSGNKPIAIMLKAMRATRVSADYHLDDTLDHNQAAVQVQTATRLLERLASN